LSGARIEDFGPLRYAVWMHHGWWVSGNIETGRSAVMSVSG
jgi:hypothetical protein